MFIRRLAPLLAVAALGLLALGAGSASATSLRFDPGNVAAPTGNVQITNTTSDPATFTTGIGNIRCNSTSLVADVNNNHATVLTGRLTQLTFSACTDTLPVINYTDCGLEGSNSLSIHAGAAGTSSITLTDVVVRCAISGGPNACYFTSATAAGTSSNAASSLTFPTVSYVAVLATADAFNVNGCGGSGTLSWTLTHLTQVGTNRTVTFVQ